MSKNTRIEYDSVGELEVPIEAYYGVQSLRAKNNFPITGRDLHPEMIVALAEIKKAAAITNKKAGLLDEKIADAIVEASDEIIGGKLHDAFIVDPIQGGAGTSANMNANEVIANRASEIMGGEKGEYEFVHPNDHVNMAQSTNDVYPTSGKIATLRLTPPLLAELKRLSSALHDKAVEFDDVIKMGRTQMQDAVPIRLGQSFEAFSSLIKRDVKRIEFALDGIKDINMGATAIGTAINADLKYLNNITGELNTVTNLDLRQAENLVDATQNLDALVSLSGAIKVAAVNISKISNDLRFMSSGPKTGIGEINLPPKQNGSSIMPGKINPVIPEVVGQVAYNVMGNDVTITMAAEAGQNELNAFEPVVYYNLYESIETMTGAIGTLIDNCIVGITANKERSEHLVENSIGIITAITPKLGYKKAAAIADIALKENRPIRELVLEQELMTEAELDKYLDPYAMTEPGGFSK